MGTLLFDLLRKAPNWIYDHNELGNINQGIR